MKVNKMKEQIHLSNYGHLNIKNINKIRNDDEEIYGKVSGLWTSTYTPDINSKYICNWQIYSFSQIMSLFGNPKPFITHMKYAYEVCL